MSLNSRFGTSGDLNEARRTYRLLNRVADPILRCSFRNMYAYAAASAGDIDEATMVLTEQLEDARKFRLSFIVPYARLIEALIALIRARFDRVSELVDEIETAGACCRRRLPRCDRDVS